MSYDDQNANDNMMNRPQKYLIRLMCYSSNGTQQHVDNIIYT